MRNLRKKLKKSKPKIKKFTNVLLGVAIFVALIGSAFSISFLFGAAFVIGFALSIYNRDLNRKPLKPVSIFVGALIIRLAMEKYLDPVLASETFMDLSVSALIFLSILIIGWKIKKS